MATGLEFAEEPVWDGRHLLVSDVQGDALYEVTEEGGLRLVETPTRWANGHSWDRSGALISAEHASGELTRRAPDGTVETLAARFEGWVSSSRSATASRGRVSGGRGRFHEVVAERLGRGCAIRGTCGAWR